MIAQVFYEKYEAKWISRNKKATFVIEIIVIIVIKIIIIVIKKWENYHSVFIDALAR